MKAVRLPDFRGTAARITGRAGFELVCHEIGPLEKRTGKFSKKISQRSAKNRGRNRKRHASPRQPALMRASITAPALPRSLRAYRRLGSAGFADRTIRRRTPTTGLSPANPQFAARHEDRFANVAAFLRVDWGECVSAFGVGDGGVYFRGHGLFLTFGGLDRGFGWLEGLQISREVAVFGEWAHWFLGWRPAS
jgi:hypothetical protein